MSSELVFYLLVPSIPSPDLLPALCLQSVAAAEVDSIQDTMLATSLGRNVLQARGNSRVSKPPQILREGQIFSLLLNIGTRAFTSSNCHSDPEPFLRQGRLREEEESIRRFFARRAQKQKG